MAITEAQLTERAATEQAIVHIQAAIALLQPLSDEGGVYDAIIDDLQIDRDTLDEMYGETFIDVGEE